MNDLPRWGWYLIVAVIGTVLTVIIAGMWVTAGGQKSRGPSAMTTPRPGLEREFWWGFVWAVVLVGLVLAACLAAW